MNKASNAFGSVTGGCSNVAGTGTVAESSACTDQIKFKGDFVTVSGGIANQSDGQASAVSAGHGNLASGRDGAWIGGGYLNTVSGITSSISGGQANSASGTTPSINGGRSTTSPQTSSPASPEAARTSAASGLVYRARATAAVSRRSSADSKTSPQVWRNSQRASGGRAHVATGPHASISGGDVNKATSNRSSILGGSVNTATNSCQSIPATNTC